MQNLTIAARLATTAVAGLAGFAAVGIYTLLTGSPATYLDLAVLMVLFTTVYVPGVFAARAMIIGFGAEHAERARTTAH